MVACLLLACSETGIDGRADGATDVNCMEPDPDSEPASCFEIFGPTGVSHSPPRRGDLGVVETGTTRHSGIGFYNFCADYEGLNVGLFFIDTGEFDNSDAYRIVSSPEPCSPIPMYEWDFDIDFLPLVPGFHRAAIRYEVTHGHYDFEFFAEAVEPGGSPVTLDENCLEVEDVLDFGETRTRSTTYMDLGFTFTCTIAWAEGHLAIHSATIEGDASGAFDFYSFFDHFAFSPVPPTIDWPTPRIDFTPPSAGIHTAELVLLTNEPVGEHRVTLTGTGTD
jgi:hypothetical protein